jgi:hypothetical protein
MAKRNGSPRSLPPPSAQPPVSRRLSDPNQATNPDPAQGGQGPPAPLTPPSGSRRLDQPQASQQGPAGTLAAQQPAALSPPGSMNMVEAVRPADHPPVVSQVGPPPQLNIIPPAEPRVLPDWNVRFNR